MKNKYESGCLVEQVPQRVVEYSHTEIFKTQLDVVINSFSFEAGHAWSKGLD